MAAADPHDGEWRRYIERVHTAACGGDRLTVMAGVVRSLARTSGWPVAPGLELGAVELGRQAAAQRVAELDLPEVLADPWLLGRVHEALLSGHERRAAGAHYTAPRIASSLIAWATPEGWARSRPRLICDPAVGGGAFLLAAAELLLASGADPARVVQDGLWGIDQDPVAVAVADAALSHWAWRADDSSTVTAGAHLVNGDALLDGPAAWRTGAGPAGFDLVVGNPPFQGQLGRTTARRPAEAAALRARLGAAVTGYADSAALFVIAACQLARPGGRVALIQPMSVFAARDVARARRSMLAGAELDAVWVAGSKVFGANVRVGAIVLSVDDDGKVDDALRHHDGTSAVRRATGPEFTRIADVVATRTELRAAPSWSHLIVGQSTPDVTAARSAGRVADIASATAGFRDQFYGLVPFVSESAEPSDAHAPLITSGLIDPAHCRWGRAPSRFAGEVRVRPVVDLAAVRAADAALGRWLDRVLVPKVLVAGQTRVVEAVVDEAGALVPSVPVIAVFANTDRLFDVAAVLLAPFTSAWALARVAGSALGGDAIKLSARQVLDVPLPADPVAWSEGAAHLRSARGGLGEPAHFASIMNTAYGLGSNPELARWWLARLPVRT